MASVVDTFQVVTNFEIGRRIVVHEQKGNKRAAYGAAMLKELSARLTEEFGAGFSERNPRGFRLFYQTYQDRLPEIWQTVSAKLPPTKEQQPASDGLASIEIAQPSSGEFNNPFTLSWSHYVELLGIKDPDERSFYEIESANSGWNVRELKRQKASGLYQRLALSRDKAGIRKLAKEGQIIARPQDLLKNPLVLEFLGLDDRTGYSESDLESAIINHLERFLLELGKGFLFEARQKRFTFGGDHYFLDLVFYNRLLRCYVIIDLKLDKLTHQDLGQMQMYVNYYDRHVKLPGEKLIARITTMRHRNKAKHYEAVSLDEMRYEVPSSWVWVRLGNISFTSDSGWSPQCLPEARSGTDWGVLKVSAVSWGVFRPDENKALPPGIASRPDCEVKAGDFLLSRANTE